MIKVFILIILMLISDSISTFIFLFEFNKRKPKIIACFLLILSMILMFIIIATIKRCPECGKFSSNLNVCPKCGHIL